MGVVMMMKLNQNLIMMNRVMGSNDDDNNDNDNDNDIDYGDDGIMIIGMITVMTMMNQVMMIQSGLCRCRDTMVEDSMLFPSKPIVRTRLWAMSQCVNMYCMT